jgi:hypothetical protein
MISSLPHKEAIEMDQAMREKREKLDRMMTDWLEDRKDRLDEDDDEFEDIVNPLASPCQPFSDGAPLKIHGDPDCNQ